MANCGNIPQVARIICPYFALISMNWRGIVCEGVVSGARTAMVFRTRRDMEDYSRRYCETFKYNHCPIAQAVGLKLAEVDEKKERNRG